MDVAFGGLIATLCYIHHHSMVRSLEYAHRPSMVHAPHHTAVDSIAPPAGWRKSLSWSLRVALRGTLPSSLDPTFRIASPQLPCVLRMSHNHPLHNDFYLRVFKDYFHMCTKDSTTSCPGST